jgi:hypothetical protein
MDIYKVIEVAAREVILGIDTAKPNLKEMGDATIDYPRELEIEFDIAQASNYTVANYSDKEAVVAKCRFKVPLFKGRREEKTELSVHPATDAVLEEKNGKKNGKKEEKKEVKKKK